MAAQSMIQPVAVRPPAVPFGSADFAWEQSQEAAVRAFRARGEKAACLHWRRGLAIARQQFGRHDPRRAASLTNCGFILARLGERSLALRHFMEAEEVYGRSWRWVLEMTPSAGAGGVYDRPTSARFRRLLEQAATNSREIRLTSELPVGLFERWRSERPPRGCDVRKLLAAVLLIASRSAPR